MKCPVCQNVDLVTSTRQGVEIDSCPNCRGVWLDRGELDKIIQHAAEWEAARGTTPPHGDPVTHGGHGSRHGPEPGSEEKQPSSGPRKPAWLDVFD